MSRVSLDKANFYGGGASTCHACGAPRLSSERFCTSCGAPLAGPRSPAGPSVTTARHTNSGDPPMVAAEVESSGEPTASEGPACTFQCTGCGSQVSTTVERRSYVCPFCDSATVIELPSSAAHRPEFVIGFVLTPEQALQKFHDWLGRGAWFRPGDLKLKSATDSQKGVYLPFWHFSARAASSWSAEIGEYWYRTETYTTRDSKGKSVTRTRRVREVEWFPLRGDFRSFHHGRLLPATRGLSAVESQQIQPFDLAELSRYRPYFLAGWMAEEASIDAETAQRNCEEIYRNEQATAIRKFLPGDEQRQISFSTHIQFTGSDLVLLPVYVLSYRYRGRQYRFLVNGQTGKAIGEKPWSWVRIAIAIGVFVAIVTAISIAASVFSS